MNKRNVLLGSIALLVVLLLSLASVACGSLEVGVERTTPPVPATLPATPTATMPASRPSAGWHLVYRLAAEGQLWAAAPDGGQARFVAELPDRAGSLALGPRHLAYVLDTRLYLLDLNTGRTDELLDFAERGMSRGLDVDLCWSSGGGVLAYAAAYENDDGSRRVELGLLDGYERRVIADVEARPAGPTPTPPPMPPAPPEPGFANLHLLGYDRLTSLLVAVPVGGQERYSSVWVLNALNGERLKTIPLYNADQIAALALSPDGARLALMRAGDEAIPSRLELYDLTDEAATPDAFALPARSHAVDLRWSPDGKSLAFLVAEGQPDLEVSPTAALWLMDVEGRSMREILKLESPEAHLIGWAPQSADHLLLAWLDGFARQEHDQLVDITSGTATDIPLPPAANVLGWTQIGQ